MNKIILAIVLLFQEYRLLIRIIKGIGVIIYSYSVNSFTIIIIN